MPSANLRRAFIGFHMVLGLALLYASVGTAIHAHHEGNLHIVLLAAVEAVGAALFLCPRTLRVGGWLLLFALVVALGHHALIGQFRPDLLVYAAGTIFVMVHGPAPRADRPAGV
jgi:hypothetical protein